MKSLVAVIVSIISLFIVSVQASAQSGVVEIYPTDNAREVVERHPAGTTFVFKAGVHRMVYIEPRDNDVFQGEPGAVLNGSRILTDFQQEGDLWVVYGQTQQGYVTTNTLYKVCDDEYPRCNRPEELYFDGLPLRHVSSKGQVTAGTWYFDYDNDRIYFADDPNGRLVETSITAHAFRGSGENNVVIRDLTIEKYATPTQQGTIHVRGGGSWLIDNVTVQWNHGAGISTSDGMRVLNSRFNNNGHLGIHGRGDNLLIEGNEIAYNNWAGHRLQWEAGGTKFSRTDGLVVRNNYVHHNQGVGLWTDIDNINVLFEGNLVTHNLRFGIFHEISYAAIIRNNTLEYNNYGRYGGQIYVSNSSDVEVYNNQVVVGDDQGDSIAIFHKERGSGVHGPWLSRNINVYNNTIVFTAGTGWAGAVLHYRTPGNWSNSTNTFDGNTYYVADADYRHWTWDGNRMTWSEFRDRYGQESNGQLIAASLPDLAELTVTGSLTEAPVIPGFAWQHEVDGASPWYHLTLRKDGQILLDQWYSADEVCQGAICTVNPNLELKQSGEYFVKVQAWSENTGYSLAKELRFEVSLPVPGQPNGLYVELDGNGRPNLSWSDDEAASWYQVYIGKPDFSQTLYDGWHQKDGALCNNGDCNLTLNVFPENGQYAVYMRSWGPGGFGEWTGPVNFDLNFPAPETVSGLVVDDNNSSSPRFSWASSEGATWYQVWVGTTGDQPQTFHLQWYDAQTIDCDDGSYCNASTNLDLPAGGEYIWYVRAWGPGGMSTGGEMNGWAEGTLLTP